ncbi:pectate lyase family protein [Streptomyces hoynatensis]|uniref:Pectate lyase n=1 Tax=Streptomyces hoynatensis TaxID=1141874 RepID=A0A3A9Z2P6_9ACTN|nr:pectate lyase [Streptomyces hoynatensis]RKN42430.1 pectate lyase [Streptomyces hoynatensis]
MYVRSARTASTASTAGTAGRIALTGCAALVLGLLPQAALAHGHPGHHGHGQGHGHGQAGDPAREVLAEDDGWAAAGGGVTGGSAADAEHTFTVSTREELAAALAAADGEPTLIRVRGTIDANTDAEGNPLSCEDYATDGYTREGYLAAYDPATWGREDPSGPLEEARIASAARQAERVKLSVGSDTTIIGLGDDARLLGATLNVSGQDNVIVRNLTFEDAFDCFPYWDPTDGEFGEWNSEYDNLVLSGSTHVWVDHNTFTDGRRPDAAQPRYFGRLFQQHDGQLDVVRGADLVTASWNVFTEHDKTILVGNSDGASATDRGRLRVTFHHNLFHNLTERAPRVRYGRVDAYNNHYAQDAGRDYAYSWGIGRESGLLAEYNAFTLPAGVDAAQTIHQWTAGTSLTENGNWVNGEPTDLLAAYRAANPGSDLGDDSGWTPELRARVDDPRRVPALVDEGAGAGNLRRH